MVPYLYISLWILGSALNILHPMMLLWSHLCPGFLGTEYLDHSTASLQKEKVAPCPEMSFAKVRFVYTLIHYWHKQYAGHYKKNQARCCQNLKLKPKV